MMTNQGPAVSGQATRHTLPERKLFAALAQARATFIQIGLFSWFTNLLMLTGPLYMLQVYDRVLNSQSVPTLAALTLLMLVLYTAWGALEWIRTSLFNAIASRFEASLGNLSADAALDLSVSHPGKATDRPLRDLRLIRRFIASPALTALFDAPWSPIFLIVLFLLHPLFGLWALFGAVVLFGLSVLNQVLSSKLLEENATLERLARQRAGEMVRSVEVIDALGMREQVKARWRQVFDASDSSLFSSRNRLSGFAALTKAFRLFLQSAILGIGAWLVITSSDGSSTPGEMIAASILMGRAIAPIEQIVGQWQSIISARSAWQALSMALSRAAPDMQSMALPPLKGHVSIDALHAGPPGAALPVLRNLSFSLSPGDVLGVLGPSAAGKSTLAKLLTGIWPASHGVIRLDGADIATLDPVRRGQQTGYLPQQTDLLSGTVRDNICRFDPHAPADAILSAAHAAACHELILSLPDGYDTDVGEGGTYLSAGQRQRIGLARALYNAPALVILDEPNSNLDTAGEAALQEAIAGLKARQATTIIVAHQPALLRQCTKLLLLEAGEIKLFGPKDEVLREISSRQPGLKVRTIGTRGESHG